MEWAQTRSVLVELSNLLTCTICKGFLKEPCTLDNCDHNFCRECIEKRLDSESKCPECGLFSWMKDLRLNHQLATTVNMTLKLQSLVGLNMEGKDSEIGCDSESLENTFSFDSDKDMPIENDDQEVSDKNCDDEQNSFGGAKSISTIEHGTKTKESGRVRETRQTVKSTTKPGTSPLTSSSLEKYSRITKNTNTFGLERNMKDSKPTRKDHKITDQQNIHGDGIFDSETSHVGNAGATTDIENSKQYQNTRKLATKLKRPKQPRVTIPRCTDTESDNESNHGCMPEATTDNEKHENLSEFTPLGAEHQKYTEAPNVTVQDDAESDSETNNASLTQNTALNVKRHTNMRKRATRRQDKIAEQQSVTVNGEIETESMKNNANLAESTVTGKLEKTAKQSSATVQNVTESGSETKNASIAEATTNVKPHTNVKKITTRRHKKITNQPSAFVQDNTESGCEGNSSTIAETTSNVKKLTTVGKLASTTQNSKIAAKLGVALQNDTQSDCERNNADTAETSTNEKERTNVRKLTTGGHDEIAEQSSVPLQNDTESDNEANNVSVTETTPNFAQHTIVRKCATRRQGKISEKSSTIVQCREESDSDANYGETTTKRKSLKRRNKSELKRRQGKKTKQLHVADKTDSKDSSTESVGEACYNNSITTRRILNGKLSLNAPKANVTADKKAGTKQQALLNSATDTDFDDTKVNNACRTASTNIRRTLKENQEKSRSSTASHYMYSNAESSSETDEETTKEKTHRKQHSDVRRSRTREDDKKTNEMEQIKGTTEVREQIKFAENTSLVHAAESSLTNVQKSSHMTKASNKSTSKTTFDTSQSAQARKQYDKKQIDTKKKDLNLEKTDRKASKQNVRKTFTNKLNPTCKTNSNLNGNPHFDFTQQEDPFHFSFSENDANGYHDHDNDESDHKNHGDHNDNDDVYNDDEDNNQNNDDDDDRGINDDGSKLSLKSASKFVKNINTKGHSNSFENGHNAENDDESLQSTRSVNTGSRNKINSDVTAEQTKKKVQFTRLKDRSTSHEQVDEIGVKKDSTSSRHGIKYDPKVVCAEDKENVTLNIKRGRMQKTRYSILQYLSDVHREDSAVNSSDDDPPVPQKRKKSRKLSTSSSRSLSQSSQNAVVLSQKSRNKKGETPLHLAAIKGDLALARKLINDGADPNMKDYAGWTPLHEACNHGHVDIVKLFLDHDALINIPGLDNDTPLHDAVANGRLKVVNLLVARGAVLTARNKQGLLPVDYAVTKAMKAALAPRDVSTSTKPFENLENIKSTLECYRESQVILGTAIRTQDQITLKKCVKQLGGTLVEEFDESVTHVVTSVNENGHCPRTIKYMCGILTGKWIISFEWIKNSLRRRQWLDEDSFEVEGTVGTTCNVARKARLNIIQQMPRLFDGCSFFLRGVFNPPTLNKQDLMKLILLGGGKLLHREPKVKDDDLTSLPSSPVVTSISRAPEVAYHAPANSTLSCCTEFILYDSMACDQPKIVCSPVLRTAPVTWLMDCISSFQLLDIPDAE